MDQILAMPTWVWLTIGGILGWLSGRLIRLKLRWRKPKTVNEQVKALFAEEVRKNTDFGFDKNQKTYRREL